MEFRVWAYTGLIDGLPPKQEQFFLQGAVREPPGYSILIPSTGRFSPVGSNLAIGYGLAGYAGSGMKGLSKFIAGTGFRFKWIEHWQVGGVWKGFSKISSKTFLYETGLSIGKKVGKIIIPFWTKERGFGFRIILWVPSSIPRINVSV